MINLYVARDGSNLGDGSLEHPFKDIHRAKRAAKVWLNRGEEVTVHLRGGEYLMSESFTLGEGENNMKTRLTFTSYEGERAVLLGGIRIEKERFTPASEEERARLIDREAAKNLMRIDLSDMRESLYPIRTNLDKSYMPTALFIGGHHMWHARYPKRDFGGSTYTYGPYLKNLGYRYSTEADNKSAYVLIDEDTMERIKLYSERSRTGMWINGFPKHEWSDETHRIVGTDDALCAILTDDTPFRYAPSEDSADRRYFLFNIFEELSAPDEYYIDYERGYVYTCVKDGIIPEDMYLGTLDEPMISVQFGGNVAFKNIDFLYSHETFASITASSGVTFEDCTMAHGANCAARLQSASGIKLTGCDIYDFNRGGVVINGCGNRSALSGAGITIDNCVMHEVDNLYQCYNPCVCVRYHGCGIKITHNTFYNATHNLIYLGFGADMEVGYNEFYNGCTDTDDSSVVYWGRDPASFGHTVHDNYFHHCMCEWATHGTAVVYQDDNTTGADIYNNVIYKCGCHDSRASSIIKGSILHHTHNNIFIEVDDLLEGAGRFGYNEWFLSCIGAYSFDAEKPIPRGAETRVDHWYDELCKAGFFSAAWLRKYKGTIWQELRDVLTLDRVARLDNYRKEIADEPILVQNAKLKYMATDMIWSRRLYDGTYCGEGSVYDYMKEHFPDEYNKTLADVEGKDEAEYYFRMSHLVAELYYFNKFAVNSSVYHYTNLTVALPERYLDDNGVPTHGNVNHRNNFNMPTDKMQNGKSIFVDYGKNFTLTPEGLEYVQSRIEGFAPIDMTAIGAKR